VRPRRAELERAEYLLGARTMARSRSVASNKLAACTAADVCVRFLVLQRCRGPHGRQWKEDGGERENLGSELRNRGEIFEDREDCWTACLAMPT